MIKINRYGISGLLLILLSVCSRADIVVDQARIRLPLPGQDTTVVYLQLKNTSMRDRVLVGAAVEGAERAEMHEHQHVDGMMRMRQVLQVVVAANSEVEFRPHGYHIMVYGAGSGVVSGKTADTDGLHQLSLMFADGEIVKAQARQFRY